MSGSGPDPRPAYDGYFADPFVWRHEGTYFAIGTGSSEAGGTVDQTGGRRVFPVLRSDDLVTWRALDRALIRPAPELGDAFWAPEVAYEGGTFYLYYSVGFGDTRHHLRVATARSPAGPYEDAGSLTDPAHCPFAIDPHPFRDVDGRWWLFHARDFLDAPAPVRAGTALVVQPLDGMTRLAAAPTVVLRARHDWQRFLAERPIYGGIYDWHTLEGPCVRVHDGRYYCFYSGGCWETVSYGVDFAVADAVRGPYSDAGGERAPRVLRTIRGRLLGPGHCSVVEGPDGEHLAYHAWDPGMTTRRMYVERLTWGAAGPRCASRR